MAYIEVKKKYSLPEWGMLKKYFEVEEAEDFPTRHAREKINDKLNDFIDILAPLLHPDTSNVTSMHEYSSINDAMRETVRLLFKKLMHYVREATELEVKPDEKNEADFINKVYKAWPSLQDEMKPICKELKECWEKDIPIKIDTGYLG